MLIIIIAATALALAIVTYLLIKARSEVASLRTQYRSIDNIDAEVATRAAAIADRERVAAAELANRASALADRELAAEAEVSKRLAAADAARQEAGNLLREAQQDQSKLAARYTAALSEYERLKREIALLEEQAEDISFGVYRPHFDFHSSEEFKRAIEDARDRQRGLVRAGQAATCDMTWTVGGSAREGERMAKQNLKMVLRAFNAECDAAIANVAWNNAAKMEERIKKSYEALNSLGTVLHVSISEAYLKLKLDELRLTYEHEQKRQNERQEQRRIREQIREEERVQREIAKAQEEAEQEGNRFEKALVKARQETERASGEKLAALQTQILQLEDSLQQAREKKLRAQSRAELTKSGYVYIISNPGSFGEHIYKIGMTRRLEPMERIAELGDASVPFPFDVHALLYSDNAPALEHALHEFLDDHRVNLVNPRKEFFTAALADIERFAKERGILVEFTLMAEAQEWRESVAVREEAARARQPVQPIFAPQLFTAGARDLPVEH